MLSQDLIAKIEADLDDLPLEPKGRRELNALLVQVGEKIRAAQERGASYAEIAHQITASGYPIKPSTLRAGLDRQRKNKSQVKTSPRRRRDRGTPQQGGGV